jgi:protein-disulfide isomerase
MNGRSLVPVLLLHLMGAAASAQQSPIPAAGFARGAEDAAIVVVEFLDFGCSACAQFATRTFPHVQAGYVATGRVRWIALPFVLGPFRNSDAATRAAICAGEQGAFWSMHDLLFEERAWVSARNPESVLSALARAAALEAASFDTCMRSAGTRDRVRQARAVARQAGVTATPMFFINGRRAMGALPWPQFQRLLDNAAKSDSSTGGGS